MLCFALLFSIMCAGFGTALTAHGTHPVFLLPGHGEAVRGNLKVHVAHPSAPLPFLNLRVFELASPAAALRIPSGPTSGVLERSGTVVWEGLLPQAHDGYAIEIETTSWPAGYYALEVQFLGDLVDERYARPFLLYPE